MSLLEETYKSSTVKEKYFAISIKGVNLNDNNTRYLDVTASQRIK
jgi:hypothetical protein